jgi:hypothetical protein
MRCNCDVLVDPGVDHPGGILRTGGFQVWHNYRKSLPTPYSLFCFVAHTTRPDSETEIEKLMLTRIMMWDILLAGLDV